MSIAAGFQELFRDGQVQIGYTQGFFTTNKLLLDVPPANTTIAMVSCCLAVKQRGSPTSLSPSDADRPSVFTMYTVDDDYTHKKVTNIILRNSKFAVEQHPERALQSPRSPTSSAAPSLEEELLLPDRKAYLFDVNKAAMLAWISSPEVAEQSGRLQCSLRVYNMTSLTKVGYYSCKDSPLCASQLHSSSCLIAQSVHRGPAMNNVRVCHVLCIVSSPEDFYIGPSSLPTKTTITCEINLLCGEERSWAMVVKGWQAESVVSQINVLKESIAADEVKLTESKKTLKRKLEELKVLEQTGTLSTALIDAGSES